MKQRSKIKYFIVGFVLFAMLVFGLYVTKAQTFNFDLEHLRQQDELLTKAYYIISIQQAWEKMLSLASGELSQVNIGIADSGVEARHQEFLNPNVNFGSTPSFALIDTRANKDRQGHGTQVAGIVGANNVLGNGGSLPLGSLQMNGILSGALSEDMYRLEVENIHKSLPSEGLGQVSSIFAALQNLSEEERGVQVINMSFGFPKCTALNFVVRVNCVDNQEFDTQFSAFKLIFTQHPDILFVAAAGNEDISAVNAVPAVLSTNRDVTNLITVGATDLNDDRADFGFLEGESNFGTTVNIAAPGKYVHAPAPGTAGSYDRPRLDIFGNITDGFFGTSASTPFVTGVAGLLKSINDQLTPEQIKDILIKTADPINTGEPNKTLGTGCYDPNNNPEGYTGCRLNAERAVCHPLALNCTPQGVIFEDDFESYQLGPLVGQGGWIGDTGPDSWQVVDQGCIQGTQCANVEEGQFKGTRKFGSPIENGHMEMWGKVQSEGFMRIAIGSCEIRFNSFEDNITGLKVGEQIIIPGGENFQKDHWYLISVEWRKDLQACRYRVDNNAWTDFVQIIPQNEFDFFDGVLIQGALNGAGNRAYVDFISGNSMIIE